MTPDVMDGRLTLTTRQVDLETYKTVTKHVPPEGLKALAGHDGEDLMMVELVSPCPQCRGVFTVGDYTCWGHCAHCEKRKHDGLPDLF